MGMPQSGQAWLTATPLRTFFFKPLTGIFLTYSPDVAATSDNFCIDLERPLLSVPDVALWPLSLPPTSIYFFITLAIASGHDVTFTPSRRIHAAQRIPRIWSIISST